MRQEKKKEWEIQRIYYSDLRCCLYPIKSIYVLKYDHFNNSVFILVGINRRCFISATQLSDRKASVLPLLQRIYKIVLIKSPPKSESQQSIKKLR
jgi:hypothetical protein